MKRPHIIYTYFAKKFAKRFAAKKSAKRLAAVFLAVAAALASAPAARAQRITLRYDGADHVYQAAPITLVINGAELTDLPMPPVILNDYTLAPVREIFESLGATVEWKAETREALVSYMGDLLILRIDSPVATLNGRYIQMDVPPKIINDKTMVPVRFPAQALGFEVSWDAGTRTVTVVTPDHQREAALYAPAPAAEPIAPAPEARTASAESGNVNELGTSITQSSGLGEGGLARDISTQGIPAENHPKARLTGLAVPQPGSPARYTVAADGPISKVEKMILPDNRLVLDFYNAECGLEPQYKSDNPIVAQVRTGQNQTVPTMITRVVFDLRFGVNYDVSIAGDRKSVTVSFERAEILDVRFEANGAADKVYITGNLRPGADIYPLANPDRVVVDMPLTTMGNPGSVPGAGRFVSAVSAEQHDANTARVTITLTGAAKYELSYDGNTAVVAISDATVRGVAYDRDSRTLTVSKAGSGLSRTDIAETDLYNSGRYVLTLPGDYSGIYGFGDFMIKDQYLDGVGVSGNNGQTSITIYEKQVFAYNITETEDAFLIRPVSPKEIYGKIVIIDPGHGGSAPGAQGWGLTEKDLTLDISKRLLRLIEAGGLVKAYATRVGDTNPDLFERPVWGSGIGDIFVSIHMNSSDKNYAANGTEVYYSKKNNGPVRGFSSEKLAGVMLDSITSVLGTTKRKVLDADFVVLKDSTIPAVLCEMGFISNEGDAANFRREEYRQTAAEALYRGILEAFGVFGTGR